MGSKFFRFRTNYSGILTLGRLHITILFPLASIVLTYELANILVKEKSLPHYEFSRYRESNLSNAIGVERTPPNLIFDHSGVLRAGINVLGQTERKIFFLNQMERLEYGKTDPTQLGSRFSQSTYIVPFFGRDGDHLFYNGISLSSRVVTPLVSSSMNGLIGRRGIIAYSDGSSSGEIVVLGVEQGVTIVTGEIRRHATPVRIDLWEVRQREAFDAPLEKITYLPFIEDGLSLYPDQKLAIRLRRQQNVFPGDRLEMNGKTTVVNGLWAGPGDTKFVTFSEQKFAPYSDTREGKARFVPASADAVPAVSIPVFAVTNAQYYQGQQRFVYVRTNMHLPAGAQEVKLTIPDMTLDITEVKGGTLTIDYAAEAFRKESSFLKKEAFKFMRPLVALDIPIFSLDANRKVIPANLTYRRKSNNGSVPLPQPLHPHKVWRGAKLWATYTGIINQHYGTFNPSGFEYIIHALGPDNREKYQTSFQKDGPDFVQISSRNFDFTDFHGWSLSNSWGFYRLVLGSYKPKEFADYAQIWEKAGADVKAPSTLWQHEYDAFPFSINEHTDGDCDLRIAEVEVEYEFSNPFRWLPLIGKTPRVVVYVSDALSMLPISIPPDAKHWTFPIAYMAGQKPTLEIRVHSPVVTTPLLTIKKITVSGLDAPQESIRAMFLPITVKNFPLCR